MTLAAFVALVLLLAAFGLALLPLLAPAPAATPEDGTRDAGDRTAALEAERRRIVDGLRDVDLDLAMGKVSREDHAALRAALEERGVDVLAALEERGRGGPGSP